LATIAKQERIRISERTIAGLEKARKQARIGGRPRLIVNRDELARLDAKGLTMAEIGSTAGDFRGLCLPDVEGPPDPAGNVTSDRVTTVRGGQQYFGK
jgi:hypothetical protein